MKKTSNLSLIDRAREIKKKSFSRLQLDDEWIEASIAWMQDELTLGQIARAASLKVKNKKTEGGAILYRVAVCLREAYRKGRINVSTRK